MKRKPIHWPSIFLYCIGAFSLVTGFLVRELPTILIGIAMVCLAEVSKETVSAEYPLRLFSGAEPENKLSQKGKVCGYAFIVFLLLSFLLPIL